MSDTLRAPTFPRPALFAAGAVMLFTIGMAAYGRLTGPAGEPPPSHPLLSRDLLFQDQADGGIRVSDAANGETVALIAPESNGFLRATMRGLARQREMQHAGGHSPFRLTAWADGRLTLVDPATGRHVELEAFGHTNEAVFAALLGPEPPAARIQSP